MVVSAGVFFAAMYLVMMCVVAHDLGFLASEKKRQNSDNCTKQYLSNTECLTCVFDRCECNMQSSAISTVSHGRGESWIF